MLANEAMAEAMEAVFEGAELSAEGSYLDDLLPVLQRLDRLVERAVAAAQAAYGPQTAADPYRGLYINQDEVTRLLAREPGAPTLQMEHDPGVSTNHAESEKQNKEHPTGQQGRGPRSLVGRWLPAQPSAPDALRANEPLNVETASTPTNRAEEPSPTTLPLADQDAETPSPDPAGEGTPLGWLARAFGLSHFDLDPILIALAPRTRSALRAAVRLFAGQRQPPPAERRSGTQSAVSGRRRQTGPAGSFCCWRTPLLWCAVFGHRVSILSAIQCRSE